MKTKLVAIFIAVAVAGLSFAGLVRSRNNTQSMEDMRELTNLSEQISSRLSNAFAYADIMELSIQSHDGEYSEEDFKALSDMAMENNTCISSFQLAPDAVITYVNPTQGNESVLGFDLLEDDAWKAAVTEAMQSDHIVTQGPVESIQGKLLIFGRKAVQVDGEFWGLATISVDFEQLLELCGMTEEEWDGNIAISVYNSEEEQVYVWGDETVLNHSMIYTDFGLPGQRWHIAMKRKHGWVVFIQQYSLYFITSLLIGIAVYILVQSVLEKTKVAKTDMLTKTMNRAEFQKQVESKLKAGSSGALLAIDLDQFKQANDTYGHLAGDQVLVCTAQRMQKAVREGDLVSRVGGDEYMIFLCNLSDENILQTIIQRLRNSAEQDIPLGENIRVNIGLSIGYAFAPKEGREYKSLYQIADERMYENKEQRKAGR